MFAKILGADRGEIAVRAFRAAMEVGARDRGGLRAVLAQGME